MKADSSYFSLVRAWTWWFHIILNLLRAFVLLWTKLLKRQSFCENVQVVLFKESLFLHITDNIQTTIFMRYGYYFVQLFLVVIGHCGGSGCWAPWRWGRGCGRFSPGDWRTTSALKRWNPAELLPPGTSPLPHLPMLFYFPVDPPLY